MANDTLPARDRAEDALERLMISLAYARLMLPTLEPNLHRDRLIAENASAEDALREYRAAMREVSGR